MSYTQKDYEADVKSALSCVERVCDEVDFLNGQVVVSEAFKCFIGDKQLKRELQILLDKFVGEYENVISISRNNNSDKVLISNRMKYLVEMIVSKFLFICIKIDDVVQTKYTEQKLVYFIASVEKFMAEVRCRIDIL